MIKKEESEQKKPEITFESVWWPCWWVALVLILANGCATPSEKRKSDVLDCVKELLERDVQAKEAYKVCNGIYRRKKLQKP